MYKRSSWHSFLIQKKTLTGDGTSLLVVESLYGGHGRVRFTKKKKADEKKNKVKNNNQLYIDGVFQEKIREGLMKGVVVRNSRKK